MNKVSDSIQTSSHVCPHVFASHTDMHILANNHRKLREGYVNNCKYGLCTYGHPRAKGAISSPQPERIFNSQTDMFVDLAKNWITS